MINRLLVFLSKQSGFSVTDIARIISSAPRRYKVFQIKKRNNRGMRVVAQPSRELKTLQRIVVSTLLKSLPIHDSCHGFVPERGIKTNARAHLDGRYILKIDLKDFFPSLRSSDLVRHMKAYLPGQFEDDEIRDICRLVFWLPKGERTLRLCIGAPSSPFISNTLMYDIDAAITSLCVPLDVVYTRYADDMTFSVAKRDILVEVELGVRNILQNSVYPRVVVNEDKTVNTSMKRRRVVTGLVISNEGSLSLGRDRKRLIRSMVHKSSLGLLGVKQEEILAGLLAFAHDIEPDFALTMRERRWRAG